MCLYHIWPYAPLHRGVTDLSLVHSGTGIVIAKMCVYTAIEALAMLESQRCTEPVQASGSWLHLLS